MSNTNEITLPVTNGYIAVSTSCGDTHVVFRIHPGSMFGVMNNNYKTRRFFKTALARMEKEVANGTHRSSK